jgi:chromosome segregation ATPase
MVERTYTSPLLTPEDLFFTLHDVFRLDIASQEDLTRLRPDHIRRLYVALIDLCYGGLQVPSKSLSAKAQKALTDLSEDLKQAVTLYPVLSDLLRKLKSEVLLELRDMTSPNEERTTKIMSDLVNFLKYRTDEEVLLAETEEMRKLALEEEEIALLRRKIDTLKGDIAETKAKKQDFDLKISGKRQKLQELEGDRRQMEEEKLSLEAEIQSLSSQMPEDPQTRALQEKLATARAKETELQGYLASLQGAMEDLEGLKREFEEYRKTEMEKERLKQGIDEKRAILAQLMREIGDIEGELSEQCDSEEFDLESAIIHEESLQSSLQSTLETSRLSHQSALQSLQRKQEELLLLVQACSSALQPLVPHYSLVSNA